MGDSSDSASLSSLSCSTSSESESSMTSENSDSSEDPIPMSIKHLVRPGISKITFEAIKKKAVKLSQKERICALLVHEVDVEPNVSYLRGEDFILGFEDFGWGDSNRKIADTAAVFMLRSVYGAWKQPVGFIFFDWPLNKFVLARLLEKVAKESKIAGLNLVSFVCSPAEYNIGALEFLHRKTLFQVAKGLEVEEGHLVVSGNEIVPIVDPCSLLLITRNNLIDGDVAFEKDGVRKVAQWKHIQQAFEIDRDLTKHLSKLTEHHVVPEKLNKGSVTNSVQVFSSTVSDFMKTIAGKTNNTTAKTLSPEAVDTAELISFLDKIFDSVNGNNSKEPNSDKPLRGLVTQDSEHSEVWLEGKEIFPTMKILNEDPDYKVTTFLFWARTLDCFELMKKKLAKMGYDSFPARSFNLDPLENCFDLMREWVKKKRNPVLTCIRFSSLYNMALKFRDAAGCQASEGNCEADGLSFLVTAHNFKTKRRL